MVPEEVRVVPGVGGVPEVVGKVPEVVGEVPEAEGNPGDEGGFQDTKVPRNSNSTHRLTTPHAACKQQKNP